MFNKKTLKDIPLQGKTVLLRADYNVPLEADGSIADDYRLVQSLPTLQYLLEHDCTIIICSHLGRPKGQFNAQFSLQPVATHLAALLKKEVTFLDQAIGDKVHQATLHAAHGEILLLENLRFYPGEEANDTEFARQLARDSSADYFIQDGFGVVHRAHASTAAITQFLPSVAGVLLEKEARTLTEVMEHPKKPLTAVLGGAKVSDKITVIKRFIEVADRIVIGGAMANTFLAYRGFEIGKSVAEDDLTETLDEIYQAAAKKVGEAQVDELLILPTDVAVAPAITNSARRTVVAVDAVAKDELILDLGTASIERAARAIRTAKTAVWSGTLGYAELPAFAHGSARVALEMSQAKGITSVVGGGDTVDFVLDWDAKKGGSFSHVSTGGSASLELLAGQKLPGIEALLDA
ncbi:MAG TPA: phosphoglycerate kinase [Verrucomicrobiae bacterium]|nr:phosphoglycerate kinase [Verrucomicrobiae bacterium]